MKRERVMIVAYFSPALKEMLKAPAFASYGAARKAEKTSNIQHRTLNIEWKGQYCFWVVKVRRAGFKPSELTIRLIVPGTKVD